MSHETAYIPGGTPPPQGERGQTNPQAYVSRRKWGPRLAFVLSIFIGAFLTVVALVVFRHYQLGWEIIVPALLPLAFGSIVFVFNYLKNK